MWHGHNLYKHQNKLKLQFSSDQVKAQTLDEHKKFQRYGAKQFSLAQALPSLHKDPKQSECRKAEIPSITRILA